MHEVPSPAPQEKILINKRRRRMRITYYARDKHYSKYFTCIHSTLPPHFHPPLSFSVVFELRASNLLGRCSTI
jgi:hypothetical protein